MFKATIQLTLLFFTVVASFTPVFGQDNAMEELRSMALKMQSSAIGLPDYADDPTHVFGSLMELNLGGTIVTITSYETGDASIYLSSGGGFIGGGQSYESVNQAAKDFVAEANGNYVQKGTLVEEFPTPKKGQVLFYLLTPQGVYQLAEKERKLNNKTSSLSPLFFSAQEVMTQYRINTQKDQN